MINFKCTIKFLLCFIFLEANIEVTQDQEKPCSTISNPWSDSIIEISSCWVFHKLFRRQAKKECICITSKHFFLKNILKWVKTMLYHFRPFLPPFSLIRDFRKQNTRGNVSKISVNHACYRQIGSKSTNHSPLAWRKEGQKVTLVVVIGGFRSDLSITRMIDGNFGNVSAGVLIWKVAYQGKRW